MVASQLGLLTAFLIADVTAAERAGALSTGHIANVLIVFAAFALLISHWSRKPASAWHMALRQVIERGGYLAGLVLLAPVVATQLEWSSWHQFSTARIFFVLFVIGSSGTLFVFLVAAVRRSPSAARRIAVLGDGEPAFRLAQQIRANMPFAKIGLYPTSSLRLRSQSKASKIEPFHVEPKLVEFSPDTVVISSVGCDPQLTDEIASKLAPLPVDVLVQAPHNGRWGAGPLVTFGGDSFMRLFPQPPARYQELLKRAFDIVVSGVLLILLLPVLCAVAVAIVLDCRGPIFFKQPRVGRGGAHFTVLKFRSMRTEAGDDLGNQLTVQGDSRVTRVGSFLRKTSMDELPQLINVLFGSMSLVGPRPHAVNAKAGGDYYGQVVANYHARHRVKPGITGLAQVMGWRGPTETHAQIEQRVANDLRYITDWSLGLDLLIIVRTMFAVCGKNAF